MKRAYTMQDMIEDILKTAEFNAKNREQGDVERTNHCAGAASGKASILRFLGVEFDFGTWQDGQYEMIGYFWVDGVELIKNGEINWKAYADAVLDEEHGWAGKELTVQERA